MKLQQRVVMLITSAVVSNGLAVAADRAQVNPAVAELAPMVGNLLEGPDEIYSEQKTALVYRLLDGGDVNTVLALMRTSRDVRTDEFVKGRVAALLPGGLEGAEASEITRRGITWGMVESAAAQLVIDGKQDEALALLTRKPELSSVYQVAGLLEITPSPKLLRAIEARDKPLNSITTARQMAFAYQANGESEKAERIVRDVTQRVNASKADRKAKPDLIVEDEDVYALHVALCNGLIYRGELDAARQRIDQQFDAAMAADHSNDPFVRGQFETVKREGYQALLAALARKGDTAAITADLERIKAVPYSEGLSIVLAYAYARNGDLPGAEKCIPVKPYPASNNLRASQASALGLIAAASVDTGKPDVAVEMARRARTLAEQVKSAQEKAEILNAFLTATLRGPEAVRTSPFVRTRSVLPIHPR